MFGAIIHHHINHHPASAAWAVTLSEDFISLYHAPLTTWPPVSLELVQRILSVILRMLFPLWIVKINAVSRFEVLLMQCREKIIRDVFFRPETIHPAHQGQYQDKNYCRNDADFSLPFFFGMVLSRVQ